MKRFLSILLSSCILFSAAAPMAYAVEATQDMTVTADASIYEDLPSEAELFSSYVDQAFFGGVATFGTAAREYLNSVEQQIYDKLKAVIVDVAANGGSTEITINAADLTGLTYSWASGTDAMAEFENQVSVYRIWHALIHDCPYDLYWLDRGQDNMSMGMTTVDDGTNVTIEKLNFIFFVSMNYQPAFNQKTTVKSDVAAVAVAAKKAKEIVDKYAQLDDYSKLVAYKDEICALVKYDTGAVDGNSDYVTNASWQLINVFDSLPATNVVSDGYTKAFQYLCDLSEFDSIRCYSVKGTIDGADWMWNIVTMEDGKTYLLDITNSDTGREGEYGQFFLAGYDDGGRWSGFVVNGHRYAYHSSTLFDINTLILADKDYLYIPQGTAHYGQCGDNVYWLLNEDGTLTITGWGDMWSEYSTSDTSSVLPPWHDYVKEVKKIVIEPGVTSISDYRFYLCQYAETATIPDTVTTIGEMAFYSCMALKELTVPDSVTSLGMGAFGNCSSLEKITLSQNITAIPDWLLNSAAITEIVIPEGVTSIGNNAFYLCNNLKTITIPATVTTVGESAFNTYPDHILEDVYYGGDVLSWKEITVGKYNENLTDAHIHYAISRRSGVVRIKGATRYETALAIADATKEQMGVEKFDTIIIASGTNFADALAGSYLAKVKNAPIIMASGKNDSQLKEYISANLAEYGQIYILGGTAAVPQSTEDTLAGYNVKRLKGKSRYETNIEILKEAGVTNQDILVATGTNFADSLSASAVGKPILLVNGKGSLSQAQINYLNSLSTDNLYILGGTGAVGENYESELAKYGRVERIKGASRYETSVAVAEKFFESPQSAVLAYAENFPDGLCGGSFAISMDAPLILTKTGKQAAAKGYVQSKGINSGAVLGGASLIDDNTAKDIFGADKIVPESKCTVCGSAEHYTHLSSTNKEKMSVALVCSELGDKSFNDSADTGLKKLKDKGLIDYKAVEYGYDNSKVNITLEDVAPEYDIVVCNNLGYGMATAWLRANAAAYPDTMFLIYDEPVDLVNIQNVQMIAYKANESDFLAGALAALISETGIIGFTGGMETPVVQDFLVGYVEGARYVNPDIMVKVSYIGSYTDAAKGKDLGKSAIDAGADVLHHVAGTAGFGYLEAAQEAGKWGIGVDFDRYEVFKKEKPNFANSIITSSVKNIGRSLEVIICEIAGGTYQWSQIRWFGIKEGGVGIAENENYLTNVSASAQAVIENIKAKIALGEIVVSTAYGMDAETLRTYY